MSPGQGENYVLLLVLLSLFAGGTLVLLSLLLLFCHRCCLGGRRYSRCAAASGAQTVALVSTVLAFKLTCFSSGPATTLRRQTPRTPKTPSPLKVGAAGRFPQTFRLGQAGLHPPPSLSQKSPFIWTNQTPSPPSAARMESPSGSSPPVIPAAESLSTNLHFMRRRRRIKATKCAGSVRNLSAAKLPAQAPGNHLCGRFPGTL